MQFTESLEKHTMSDSLASFFLSHVGIISSQGHDSSANTCQHGWKILLLASSGWAMFWHSSVAPWRDWRAPRSLQRTFTHYENIATNVIGRVGLPPCGINTFNLMKLADGMLRTGPAALRSLEALWSPLMLLSSHQRVAPTPDPCTKKS